MNVHEAINILAPDTNQGALRKYDTGGKSLKAVNDACRIACKALEKQLPKKTTQDIQGCFSDYGEYGKHEFVEVPVYHCPECGNPVGIDYGNTGVINNKREFCDRCGQKIDWSGQ